MLKRKEKSYVDATTTRRDELKRFRLGRSQDLQGRGCLKKRQRWSYLADCCAKTRAVRARRASRDRAMPAESRKSLLSRHVPATHLRASPPVPPACDYLS